MNQNVRSWVSLMGVFCFSMSLLAACHSEKAATQKAVEKISARESFGLLRNQFAVLVDVREEDEVTLGLASDAKWMPISKITANDPKWIEFREKLPKDKKIIFYCKGGGRAQTAAEALAKQGYQTANMGSYDDWVKEGFPVKQTPY